MKKWINLAVLLAGGIVLASCSGVTPSVKVGFQHLPQEIEADTLLKQKTSGVGVGGDIEFRFEEDGAVITPCGHVSYTFGETDLSGSKAKITTNLIPGSLCFEMDTQKLANP